MFFSLESCRFFDGCFPTPPLVDVPDWMLSWRVKGGQHQALRDLGDEPLKKCECQPKMWVRDSRSQLLQCVYILYKYHLCIYMLFMIYYNIMLFWFIYTQSVYFWANDVTTLACRFPDICNLWLMNSIYGLFTHLWVGQVHVSKTSIHWVVGL